jgi:hypothetical protein
MITPTDFVLIAILNNQRDLDVIRLLGWYRIPLRFAPKVVHVDAVAFYQTAEFGEEKWSIRHAARVTGVELVRRTDLFQGEENHPRANEEYYKLQLGPLETLPRIIQCDAWKRVTFLYTTGEKLFAAEKISDLALTGSDRDVLWRALRESNRPQDSSFETGSFPWPDALDAFYGWSGADSMEDKLNPEQS